RAGPYVIVQPPGGDVLAVRNVVARRVGVRADVHGRPDVREGDVRAGRHVEVDRVHVRRVARPDVDGRIDERRDVEDHTDAITLNSTAMGVGRESTPTVVRVGWILPKYSAYTLLKRSKSPFMS